MSSLWKMAAHWKGAAIYTQSAREANLTKDMVKTNRVEFGRLCSGTASSLEVPLC